MLFFISINAKEWQLQNIFFQIENDADFRTDRDYTHGGEMGALYQTHTNTYISFSYAQQMFTPEDFDEENIDFTKERPYAGYMYLGGGYHTVENTILTSYNIQIGFVGPSVKMDKIQKAIHSLIGAHDPQGWDEQIKDEPIFQFNIEQRYFFQQPQLFSYYQNIIPYWGINLGNASTKAVVGGIYRLSYQPVFDFGASRVDYRGYNNIPLSKKDNNDINFIVSLWIEGSIVARDIFLDGNTFKDSVHVDKEILVAKGGFGLGFKYQKFLIEWIRTFSTKEFKTQDYYHSYGSLLLSYSF